MQSARWRCLVAAAFLGPICPALAQDAAQVANPAAAEEAFGNPPVLGQSAVAPKGTLYRALPSAVPLPHAGREQVLDLKVVYTEGRIRKPGGSPDNPFDRVRLRSYQGTNVDPDHPFVAPTIEAMPGDTIRVRLDNQLPADPSCTSSDTSVDTPHCFNGTNLHSHGLWVSPTGNSDNVLLSINPGMKFEYEYNIPVDHPAGTFWYHPHRHGSTALQVGSGMAGALIIRGDRPPTGKTNGDLDTLVKPFPERLLVFEQIPYACLQDGKLKQKFVPDSNDPKKGKYVIDWTCEKGEVGEVISYDQFTPSSWDDSGRFTTVNGRVRPVFANAETGKTERWRLVHAGVRDTIQVEFRKMNTTDFFKRERSTDAAGEDRFANDLCTGQQVPYVVAASDGLTMEQGQVRKAITLQPGYRNDLLVNFPEDGIYCIVNPPIDGANSVTRTQQARSVLGFVRVKGGKGAPASGDPIAEIKKQLIANAKAFYTPEVANTVVTDLQEGLKLTKFIPHPTVTDEEVAGQPKQDLVFFINLGPGGKGPNGFQVGNNFNVVQNDVGVYVPAGAKPYDPDVVDRKLVLGTAQEWELRSYFVSHPFHIHVNPFQIVRILDPAGNDVSGPVTDGKENSDSQYAGLRGVWKDTLWIKSNVNNPLTAVDAAWLNGDLSRKSIPDAPDTPDAAKPQGVYRIFIRTRYERYIGEFVLHCHILDHEDQGMMQNVSIGLPDGAGGLANAHHHGSSPESK
ncbi:multicopper oxidase domain-containing protein [Agrobacterium vitis]|uniref:Multicopper oxidase domain-containing protein n=1 Tax=Agrobacterium vitis TaxID=373 RepID=A0ABD6G8S0_AGRVI|nr:multicopper oxidase domain-containing protein [Agrobacterium vitis]MUO79383.1 multicopper oxidase domain-containing protein [Agrobacterium vitis]MUO96208.1 multicopper oxidase domain-containing protein [Agrobacterium vitis]MUP05727.1 multicopper oxidase domain-containing protein [Agrobacterium vitis]MUZ82811.1 multicopper oxidase domain-containing protein [Agrobacterium vitis]MVA11813.1 multicopper oxidase domain-containing protein [Agrobacterium vitis]